MHTDVFGTAEETGLLHMPGTTGVRTSQGSTDVVLLTWLLASSWSFSVRQQGAHYPYIATNYILLYSSFHSPVHFS